MTAFELAGLLEALTVVSINDELTYARSGKKIRLPIAEVLFHAAIGNLSSSKKL